MSSEIRGVLATPFTPFTPRGEIDEETLGLLLDFQLKGGVHGLWVLGTAGQGPAMSPEERMQVCETIIGLVRHRIPVIVQVGTPDTPTTVKLALHAERAGADAVSSLPPFYFPHNEYEIFQHFATLARSVNLPVYVYNNPTTTHIDITPETLNRLNLETKNVIGVKESNDTLRKLQDELKLLPKDFQIFPGYERYLLPTLPYGGRGCTSIPCANSFPEVTAELYHSIQKRDWSRALELQGLVYDIYWLFYRVSPSLRVASEEALRFRGYDVKLLPRWSDRPA